MLDRLEALEAEYSQVLTRLSDPTLSQDPRELRVLSRRHKELETVVRTMHELKSAQEDVAIARELAAGAVGAERELGRDEQEAAEARVATLEEELRELLVPHDPNDGRNVIVEIRGAEGGEEANLFAKDLFDMYHRYADRRSWHLDVLDQRISDLGGIDGVTFLVKGDDAWRRLHLEAGTHRVQRIPVTESQGRVHTSSATVNVLPEADEVEVEIDPDKDLRIDVYRSTGPGGQSVNTTDSAVRITHLPTGLVVAMQDEKSQIQNRAAALKVLRARLYELEQQKNAAALARQRRAQVGGGGRSEKIRTYNFKDNRVTDHRIGLTLKKLDRILMGDLDELVDRLLEEERKRQLLEG
ncbi:MAG TPA: peptide chain release factor 1 [Acidimicrobiales bacterium]|nr:peptide chain release factor 1 [Acidimicrobiales bacterium]